MSAIRFSANLGLLWSDLPLLTRIERAAAAGFPAVELHWPYETPPLEVRDACRTNGLELLSLNTPPGEAATGELGLAALPERSEEFRESFRKALDYAGKAGASSLHVMAGMIGPSQEAEATFVENLRWAADRSGGTRLLLEALNSVDRPGYFYSKPAEAADLIMAIGAPNVSLMFDAYHVAKEGLDAIAEFDRLKDRIGHVQIAAVPDRGEPDRGTFDGAGFLRHLVQGGYEGWVGCEYTPRGRVEDGLGFRDAFHGSSPQKKAATPQAR